MSYDRTLVGGCKKCLVPILQGHVGMHKEGKPHLYNMVVLVLSSPVQV
jgi:hypothetical protein